MELREKVTGRIDEKKERILEVYHFLYEHPETSLQEYESSKKLTEVFREEGFEVTEHLEGMETAFKAVKKNGNGPRIAIIAEYDALPGNGHACGHHMIASMSLGAALGLSSVLDELEGEVAVFGTPAEETGHGKPYLIEHGAFDGYDMALMVHPGPVTDVYIEIISIGGIDFKFKGVAAHAGASPYDGVNALDAMVLFYNGISMLRQQLRDGSRIHGIVIEAGSAANIIPDFSKIRLEFRSKDHEYFEEIVKKVIRCAEGAAHATGCTLEYEHFEPTCKGFRHNHVLGEIFTGYMNEMGFEDASEEEKMSAISSDFGNLSQIMPSIQPILKVAELRHGLHTNEFRDATLLPYAQDKMIKGAKILALTVLDALTDPEVVKKAWDEFGGHRT